jgi:hypothetical protein
MLVKYVNDKYSLGIVWGNFSLKVSLPLRFIPKLNLPQEMNLREGKVNRARYE